MTTELGSAPAVPQGSAPLSPRVATDRVPRHRLRLAVVAVVLVGAVGFLLFEGLGSSLNYFETVNQALGHRAMLGTTTFRLEGNVVPGSVEHTALGANFTVAQGTNRIAVVNTGTPPQLFKANIAVVVVGHFTTPTSTNFLSNQILVDHSQQYIAAHPGRVKSKNGSVH